MLKKGTKLYSILKFKCPHCHEGDFFVSNNPYNIKSMGEVKDTCDLCKRKFSIEPGFYYGAMYVSYSFGVATIVSFLVAKLVLGFEMEFWNFIIMVGTSIVLLTPLYYSLSKIVWANMFMSYKENIDEKS